MNPFKHYGFETDTAVERLYPFKEGAGQLWLGLSDTTSPKPIGIKDNRHIVTVAGSRTGKGTAAIVPNLCLYPGSVVCLDPKGENASLTADRRGKGKPKLALPGLGQQVVVLDPFGKSKVRDEYRGRFNPLESIDVASLEAVDQAGDLANALVVISNDKDAHWDESARNFVKALILHVKSFDLSFLMGAAWTKGVADSGGRYEPDLPILRDLLMRGSPYYAELWGRTSERKLTDFEALLQSMLDNPIAGGVVASAASALQSLGASERASILSTARRNTEFLDSPAIRENLSGRSSFHPRDLKHKAGGVTVYVCLPSGRLHAHFRWMRMILISILGAAEQDFDEPATKHSTLFILDEFAQLNRVDLIEKAAGLMAGYRVQLWVILQDLTQLQRLYKDSWETFLGNAGVLQFFGNTDLTTLKYISSKIGRYDVLKKAGGQSSESDLLSESEIEKILCREDETQQCYQLPYALQIVLLAGRRPLLARKTPYYKSKSLFKLAV